ncbi:MAG: PadR family transcriptional regulator [Bacteroidota bacterium]
MYSKELLKGTIEALILQTLESRGRLYGYEIAKQIKEISDEKIMISEGSLYPILHKLERDGVLEAEKEKIGRRVRRYYKLTSKGKPFAAAATAELQDFLQTVQHIIQQLQQPPQTI